MTKPHNIIDNLQSIGVPATLKEGTGKNGPYTRIEFDTPAADFMSVYIDCSMQGEHVASTAFKSFSRSKNPREGQSAEDHKAAQQKRERYYHDAYKVHALAACAVAMNGLQHTRLASMVKDFGRGLPGPEYKRLKANEPAQEAQEDFDPETGEVLDDEAAPAAPASAPDDEFEVAWAEEETAISASGPEERPGPNTASASNNGPQRAAPGL